MTSNRHLTGMDGFDTMVLQAKHKECNMGYTIEFNDDAMRYADYAAVEQYQMMRLPLSFVEELMDYVTGMGYDWNTVAYVREMVSA
jgi:hypothetical protein